LPKACIDRALRGDEDGVAYYVHAGINIDESVNGLSLLQAAIK
jgi:hypothetical protein